MPPRKPSATRAGKYAKMPARTAKRGGAKKDKKPPMSREEKVRSIEDTLGDIEV